MMPAWVGRLRTHGTSSASLPSPLRINMFGPVGTAGTVDQCFFFDQKEKKIGWTTVPTVPTVPFQPLSPAAKGAVHRPTVPSLGRVFPGKYEP